LEEDVPACGWCQSGHNGRGFAARAQPEPFGRRH
jgi:hypothetical protein